MAQISKINLGGIDYDVRDKVLEKEVANIKPIINQGTINNAADEEDITSVDNLLKLKDRTSLSGKAYVILRKGKTFAEQVKQPNTIYEVRYEHDLNGATFTMPNNSALYFLGGKISNGTLVGNSTEIAGATKDILDNVILSGDYTNLSCNLTWWGADNTEGFDNSAIIGYAFRSSIPVIEVSGRYYISKPIELPYNKVIKGRTGNNNKLTGFYANDDFSSAIVNFPDRQGSGAFSKDVCAMFYHRDTTKLEMHDIFVDARHKADYCIEHIDLYGSVDMYNCYLSSANAIGMLQYGCENPVYDQLYIIDCHIGLMISVRAFKGGNPLGDEFYVGEAKGQPNIVTTTNLRVMRCNYGLIVNGAYDIKLDNFETAYNAIAGAILRGVYGEINKYYSEADARCSFYIHADGTREEAEGKGYALQYLIDNNLDGYKAKALCCQGADVYLRAPVILMSSQITLTSASVSFSPRGYTVNDAETYEWMNNREPQGIDSLFLLSQSVLTADSIRTYIAENGYVNDALNSVIVSVGDFPSIAKVGYCHTRGIKNVVNHISNINLGAKTELASLTNLGVTINNVGDFNCNIEESRRDFSYQKKDERSCKYYGMEHNIPLYYYDASIMSRPIWWNLQELKAFFGEQRIIKVNVMLKVLKPCNLRPYVQVVYADSKYQTIYTSKNNDHGDEQWGEGVYNLVLYVPLDVAFAYENFALNFQLNATTQDCVVSHLYIYAADDNACAPHNFVSVTLPSGYTAQRPAISFRGQTFFDRNLNKVIYANETLDGWIDATGASV